MNKLEESVKKMLEIRGFSVLRSGWPDFLCTRRYTKQLPGTNITGEPVFVDEYGVMGVEVKSAKDKLTPTQETVHKVLRAARIPIFVVRPGDMPKFKTRHFLTIGEITHFKDGVGRARVEAKRVQQQIEQLQTRLRDLHDDMERASTIIGA